MIINEVSINNKKYYTSTKKIKIDQKIDEYLSDTRDSSISQMIINQSSDKQKELSYRYDNGGYIISCNKNVVDKLKNINVYIHTLKKDLFKNTYTVYEIKDSNMYDALKSMKTNKFIVNEKSIDRNQTNKICIKIAKQLLSKSKYSNIKKNIIFLSTKNDIEIDKFIHYNFKDGKSTQDDMDLFTDFCIELKKELGNNNINIEVDGSKDGNIYGIGESVIYTFYDIKLI